MGLKVSFEQSDVHLDAKFANFQKVTIPDGSGGMTFEVDETLSLKNGILSVNTAKEPEPDNTLPITSAAVHTTVGNINALLETI